MKRYLGILTTLVILFAAAGCSKKPLLEQYNWNPRVHYALTELLTDYGNKSKSYDPDCRPYAVFDYDNTTIIDDIAQTLLVYQIENLAFQIRPEDLFEVLTRGIKDLDMGLGNGWTPRILAEDLCGDYDVLYPLREDLGRMRGTEEYKDFRPGRTGFSLRLHLDHHPAGRHDRPGSPRPDPYLRFVLGAAGQHVERDLDDARRTD